MEFVVNIPHRAQIKKADLCGVKSGKDINKWDVCKFEKYPSKIIKTPQIENCPISIECKVKNILELGSHDCFLAEVVNVSVLPELVNKNNKLILEKTDLVTYVHGFYQATGKIVGSFGYSVKKGK